MPNSFVFADRLIRYAQDLAKIVAQALDVRVVQISQNYDHVLTAHAIFGAKLPTQPIPADLTDLYKNEDDWRSPNYDAVPTNIAKMAQFIRLKNALRYKNTPIWPEISEALNAIRPKLIAA